MKFFLGFFLCILFSLLLFSDDKRSVESSSHQALDTWLGAQEKILKEQELKTPPEQLEGLVNHVFLVRFITCDQTILPSQWERVTGDGAQLDPWDLTNRMWHLGQKMNWPVFVSECGLGPVLLVGEGEERVATITVHGKDGRWANWYPDQILPSPFSLSEWEEVLQLRQGILEARVGRWDVLNRLPSISVTSLTGTLAKILKKDPVSVKELEAWRAKWPESIEILENILRRARQLEDGETFERVWSQIPSSQKKSNILFEGVLWARLKGESELASQRLDQLLQQDPYYVKALMLKRSQDE